MTYKNLCAGLLVVMMLFIGSQQTTTVIGDGTQQPTLQTFPSKLLHGHTSPITILAWSPDSQVLASVAGGFQSTDFTVRLWRTDGTLIASLVGHTEPVQSLAWSPDGKWLATGSADQTIRLWQPDGTLVRVIHSQAGTVFALARSPDGKMLASGSVASPTQNTVQLWDIATGKLLKTLTTAFSGGKFYNLGWSPDGKYLVGGASSYTEWRADGTQVFSYESCAHCTPAWGFAWSPDSSEWAIGDEGGGVQIYTVQGQIHEVRNANSDVNVLAWSPDGQLLAGGNVYLWNPEGQIVGGLTPGHATTNLVWSPDSTHLATSDGDPQSSFATIQLWNRNGTRWTTLSGHTQPVSALAWSPDGKTLASGSLDQTIRLWDLVGS